MTNIEEYRRKIKKVELEGLSEEAGINENIDNTRLETKRILLSGYFGYLVGRLSSNKSLSCILAGVLSSGSVYFGRGCEFRKHEYSTKNVKILERNIGTDFSDEAKITVLQIGKGFYLVKTSEQNDIESIVKIEETAIELETRISIIRGIEYKLEELRKVELRKK